MSNEIWHSYQNGSTLYALIWRQTDDKVYDAVAAADTFDVYADADIATYDVPLTEAGTTGDYYSVDFPAGISAGVYRVQIFYQPGVIDVDADRLIAQGEIYWDGTAEINIYTSSADVDLIIAKLPDDYIMGSSVTTSMDDEINAIVANLGQVHTTEDESPGGGSGGASTTSGIAEGC